MSLFTPHLKFFEDPQEAGPPFSYGRETLRALAAAILPTVTLAQSVCFLRATVSALLYGVVCNKHNLPSTKHRARCFTVHFDLLKDSQEGGVRILQMGKQRPGEVKELM